MWAKIVCLVIGYGFGLFQTGYFYGKRNGIDIRKYGSGNAGTMPKCGFTVCRN